MSGSLQDHLRRAVAPRIIVAASEFRPKQILAAAAFRAFGRLIPIELFFAFDDAYAAIALPGLIRLAQQRPVQLILYPIVERGIAGDPALAARLKHSIQDARLLAQREDRQLSRTQPADANDTAFLAVWTHAARGNPSVNAFAAAAIEEIWLRSNGGIPKAECLALHRSVLGSDPANPGLGFDAGLASNSRRLRGKGHWESPVANICGEWFFAHERLTQIAERLDEMTGGAV